MTWRPTRTGPCPPGRRRAGRTPVATSGTRSTQIRVLSRTRTIGRRRTSSRSCRRPTHSLLSPSMKESSVVRMAGTTRPMASSSSVGSRKKSAKSPSRCLRRRGSGAPPTEAATSCASRRRANQAGTTSSSRSRPPTTATKAISPYISMRNFGCSSAKSNSIDPPFRVRPRPVARPAVSGPGHRRGSLRPGCSRCRRAPALVVLAVDPVDHALPERPRADGGRHQVGAVEAEDAGLGPAGSGRRACRSGWRRWRCPACCSPMTQLPSFARLLAYSAEAR